ncbi:MAG: elongation factor P maturation arginine rhamnosyltransferase EarP, partial [Pseudomonadota bacterium]
LWLDDTATLHRIWPEARADATQQQVAGIEVRHWPVDFPEVTPAPLVIETFGCRLPESYLAAMSAREPKPLWLNLDHLSAEAWVKDYHGLPSPHPRLPLTAYFFYPGFEVGTGGLIREADLTMRRQAMQTDPTAREAFWRSLRLTPPDGDTLSVSLFAYDNPAIPALLAAWVNSRRPVRCLVPEGIVLDAVGRFFATPLAPGQQVSSGALEVCALPFFDQDGYDRLLWACDLNFVRGEDSFVRAQWAALPMVWNIYVQEAGAHWPKLHAFLDRYCLGMEPAAAKAYRQFTEAWNRNQDIAQAWPALLEQLPALSRHSQAWAEHLAAMPDLASQLMLFCQKKL